VTAENALEIYRYDIYIYIILYIYYIIYIIIIIFICNTWVLNYVGRNHKEDMVPAGIWSAREVASLHGNKKMFL